MPDYFTPETWRFLRGLAKHNDRAWFEERRPVYERALKQPLHALIEAINAELDTFAPEYLRPPHKIAMRIFRDTRFSPDKRPYKTHLAAWWARQGFEKRSAAGFYLQAGPEGGFLGAAIYAPERDDLLTLRRWLANHHERYRQTLAPLLAPANALPPFNALEPNALTRNPQGSPRTTPPATSSAPATSASPPPSRQKNSSHPSWQPTLPPGSAAPRPSFISSTSRF